MPATAVGAFNRHIGKDGVQGLWVEVGGEKGPPP
jgi:hypothetical protein